MSRQVACRLPSNSAGLLAGASVAFALHWGELAMLANLTPPVDDLLAAMLARGDAPTLDALLDLCPDEPLADVDEIDREGMTARRHAEWWSWATDLRIQYPGFEDAYWYLEYMKYGRSRGPLPDRPLPYAGAPLSEFVGARISHAKALWSRDVSCRWTQLQFRDWLRLHCDGETWIPPLWPDQPGWSEALQVLRIAYGLPGLDPTITWELRPPPRRASR
jgi:hypothetical protein